MKRVTETCFVVLSHKEITFDNRVQNQINAVRQIIPNVEVIELTVKKFNFITSLREFFTPFYLKTAGQRANRDKNNFGFFEICAQNIIRRFFRLCAVLLSAFVRLFRVFKQRFIAPHFNFISRMTLRTTYLMSDINNRFSYVKKKPVLIIANDIDTLLAGIICKYKFKATLIYDMHEFERSRHPVGSSFERLIIAIAETLMFPFVDYIWTVSFSIKKYYKRRFPKNKISLVLNAPNLQGLVHKKPAKKTDLIRSKHFICVGNVSFGRNFEEVIYAFGQHPDFKLTIIGDINPKFEKTRNIKEKIENLPNVVYKSRVPPEQLANIVSEKMVSLCLYDTDIKNYDFALPNKLLLALITQTPIVCFSSNEVKILETKIGVELNKISHINELFSKNFASIAMPANALYFFSMQRQKVVMQKIVEKLI